MSQSKKVVVLFHEHDRHYTMSRYIVHYLADTWRSDGHDVAYVFGVRKRVPADIVLVHVNLSVVPEEYLRFAAQYPIALNGRLRDIRKSTISKNLVVEGDSWDGPVIAKSNLNCAGGPELLLRRTWLERKSWRILNLRRKLDRLGGDPYRFVENADYRIFDRFADVPEELLKARNVVVEKFRPEFEGARYHTRVFQFFGDCWSCQRTSSFEPIVKAGASVETAPVEPHDEVIAARHRFRMDYGKLDYVISDGEFVLLDVNKTIGASLKASDEHVVAARRQLARGLYDYFDQERSRA